ncbi:transmembrane sensor [Rhizomicrobium palustre]|uniref:Transmembrane sensor n=1 Tax=Rhizomicrobium palustre TaxID=189966 RepID=A0A846MUA7_9PROT|nr:FecR domain-containing protein [Rhizomicrobium palustre]NIK86791.1 transmembrane sensor [Rhizomicrobium palustre]
MAEQDQSLSAKRQIEAEARDWLMAVYAGKADQAGFHAWLSASSAHARAYRQLEQAWRDLPLSEALDVEIRRKVGARQRWFVPAALAASLLLCLGLGVAWKASTTGNEAGLAYASEIGKLRTVNLPDGSTVALGADSAMAANFSKTARAITLDHGRAYFDIAHDAARPLTVTAGNASLHVLGTAFEVWKGPSGVRLSVTRGRVAVGVNAAPAYVASLGAGEQIVIHEDGSLTKIAAFAEKDLLAWRQGRLVYRDAALADVVADMNRYRALPVKILDPKAGALRVTAAFRADQSEQVLAGLAASQPIRLEKSQGGVILRAKN